MSSSPLPALAAPPWHPLLDYIFLMAAAVPLLGRDHELQQLEEALALVAEGGGGLMLVTGEAGVGKTTFVEAAIGATDTRVLRGNGDARSAAPMESLMAALPRSVDAHVLDAPGPSATGSGPAQVHSHGPSAVRRSFEDLAEEEPTVLFLDDLQWADAATVAVLEYWVAPVSGLPLLVIGAYRSNELPRRHPMRGVSAGLRRMPAGAGKQIILRPLTLAESSTFVRAVLGEDVDREVIEVLHRRAGGLPFYLEELTAALAAADHHAQRANPNEIVPESVREVAAARLAMLSNEAQLAAEIVSVAAAPISVDQLVEMGTSEEALEELFDTGMLVEEAARGGDALCFRHTLLAEGIYSSTPWTRRRQHHALLARTLEASGGPAAVIAGHWDRARKVERARPNLVLAARDACAVHAYRDAMGYLDRALADWPAGEDPPGRLAALNLLGDCSERCGEVGAATAAWEAVAVEHRRSGPSQALGEVNRRLAGVYELANDWSRAVHARLEAAEIFAGIGLTAEAASERLTVATHFMAAGDLTEARRLIHQAWRDIATAEDAGTASGGLRARAMGVDGYLRSMLGETTAGVDMTRHALEMALDGAPAELAAEAYFHHAYALEQATRYEAALEVMGAALGFCRQRGLEGDAHVCLACITPALRHTGQWDQALEVGQEVLAATDAPELARMVATGEIGLILANRGDGRARTSLARAGAFARVYELFPLEIETTWGLARMEDLGGDERGAAARLRDLVARCADREEYHYSVAAVRWAASFFGIHGLTAELGACTDLLAGIAQIAGTAEATAALAHALGEIALLENAAPRAADQFARALELLGTVSLPPESAETQVRLGAALAASGNHAQATIELRSAFQTARVLGALPLMAVTRRQLADLGVDIARRSRRGEDLPGVGGRLTPREQQVLELLAVGHTNREIASELFVSTRTVDMHVRNLLTKLGSRTRTGAAARATELGLLEPVR